MNQFIFYQRIQDHSQKTVCKEIWINWINYEIKLVKRINTNQSIDLQYQLINEINIISEINEPFIVKTHGYLTDHFQNILLFQDYYSKGTLRDNLSMLSEKQKLVIIFKIAQAISSLNYKFNVVYRNLSPDNILLLDDLSPILDNFGISKQLSFTYQKMSKVLQFSIYNAPEIYQGSYQLFVDVWSLGVLVIWMFTGKEFEMEYYMLKRYEQLNLPDILTDKLPAFGLSFLELLLEVDPSKRPDIKLITNLLQKLIEISK
ncbi:Kinase [Spironucleus salmonicida]|uniref:Kinase n=1 Tax=Spironucleus salmonicida TaxID=348837 RepID=V6LLB6_9EUKA|nr:Kinase [Spironucleus salmonicida]|eukprot:EST41469.1 Kinase [Spironucleus salmonicida]